MTRAQTIDINSDTNDIDSGTNDIDSHTNDIDSNTNNINTDNNDFDPGTNDTDDNVSNNSPSDFQSRVKQLRDLIQIKRKPKRVQKHHVELPTKI